MYAGYKDRKDWVGWVSIKFCSHVPFFISNILGNVQTLTIGLRLVGGDLDEVDSVLVAVVMMFGGRSRACARLMEQERCGRNNQDTDNYSNCMKRSTHVFDCVCSVWQREAWKDFSLKMTESHQYTAEMGLHLMLWVWWDTSVWYQVTFTCKCAKL